MKERLTGAIILVALIVLLVPELLTGPIRKKSAPAASSSAASVAAPLAGAPAARTADREPPLRSYTLTLGGQGQAQAPVAASAAQTPAQTADKISGSDFGRRMPPPKGRGPGGAEQTTPESSQQSSAESSPQSSAHTPAASQIATPRQGARHISQHSTGAGSGSLQAPKSPAHTVMREARSSASSGGWVVQLGSFGSRPNADRLARTLRGRGFRMTVSPARAGSRVLWRVRAGPARDRVAALHLAARLRALGHRGELIPLR